MYFGIISHLTHAPCWMHIYRSHNQKCYNGPWSHLYHQKNLTRLQNLQIRSILRVLHRFPVVRIPTRTSSLISHMLHDGYICIFTVYVHPSHNQNVIIMALGLISLITKISHGCKTFKSVRFSGFCIVFQWSFLIILERIQTRTSGMFMIKSDLVLHR